MRTSNYKIQKNNTTSFDRYPNIFKALRKIFLGFDGRTPKILSFGCSTGEELLTIKSYLPNSIIHGCDIEPGVLQIASSRDEKILVYESTPSNISTNGPYDLILCLSVFCLHGDGIDDIPLHFPFAKFEDIFGNCIHQNLSENGVVVVVNSNYFFQQLVMSDIYHNISLPSVPENTFTAVYDKNNKLALDRHLYDYYGLHEVVSDYYIPDNWITDCIFSRAPLKVHNFLPDVYTIQKSEVLNFPPRISPRSRILHRGRVMNTVITPDSGEIIIGNNFRRRTDLSGMYYMGEHFV